jgi:hypothetical protein
MAGQEAAGSVVGERVAGRPSDGPAPGADIAERVPRWRQVRILIGELVPEAAKGALALDGPCQSAPGPWLARMFHIDS